LNCADKVVGGLPEWELCVSLRRGGEGSIMARGEKGGGCFVMKNKENQPPNGDRVWRNWERRNNPVGARER